MTIWTSCKVSEIEQHRLARFWDPLVDLSSRLCTIILFSGFNKQSQTLIHRCLHGSFSFQKRLKHAHMQNFRGNYQINATVRGVRLRDK